MSHTFPDTQFAPTCPTICSLCPLIKPPTTKSELSALATFPSKRSLRLPSPSLPSLCNISIMATIPQCQPTNLDTNQHLDIMIRLLAIVGFSYLLKSFYQLLSWLLVSHRSLPSRHNGKHHFLPLSRPSLSTKCSQAKHTLDPLQLLQKQTLASLHTTPSLSTPGVWS